MTSRPARTAAPVSTNQRRSALRATAASMRPWGRRSYMVDKAPKKRKWCVVGGGPAGMEAARVSALRGHEVTLIEKSSRLGGLLPLAALIKGIELEDLPGLIRYLKTQLAKLGVKVELGQGCDPVYAFEP